MVGLADRAIVGSSNRPAGLYVNGSIMGLETGAANSLANRAVVGLANVAAVG